MSTRWKLVTALGLAGAIALSIPAAEARNGRNAAIIFGAAAGALALGAAAAASQPRYQYYDGYYGGPYAYSPQPYVYESPGYYDVPAPVYFEPRPYRGNRQSLQIPGTNYNPNQ